MHKKAHTISSTCPRFASCSSGKLALGMALTACFFCVSCSSKPSRSQLVENLAVENQNNIREMEYRVVALENRVDGLAADANTRTYEVRNKAGRKTGHTAHPLPVVTPQPVAVSPVPTGTVVPAAPLTQTSPVVQPSPATPALKATAPMRTLAQVEEEKLQGLKGNSSPALSLPPNGATPAAAPQAPVQPSTVSQQAKSASNANTATTVTGARSPRPVGRPVAAAPAASAVPVSPALPPQGAAQSAAVSAPLGLSLPPEGASPAVAPVAVQTAPAAQQPKAAKGGGLPPAAKGEEAAYKAALQLVTSGRAEQGRAKFQEFLQSYPSGRFAANAHYWIGESYYSQRNYTEALMAFKQVSAQFPTHHKTADALLKAGMTYQRLGDKENAQLQYKALQADFPNSEAAQRMRGRTGR